jgi:hypothetical protein
MAQSGIFRSVQPPDNPNFSEFIMATKKKEKKEPSFLDSPDEDLPVYEPEPAPVAKPQKNPASFNPSVFTIKKEE